MRREGWGRVDSVWTAFWVMHVDSWRWEERREMKREERWKREEGRGKRRAVVDS